ncbi:MAG: hypothetical protein CSA62_02220 [Planctomycetota bacterium]|nr:MAG: hypothetical protein CSA62_02220 [Planctomycetota bacterium]
MAESAGGGSGIETAEQGQATSGQRKQGTWPAKLARPTKFPGKTPAEKLSSKRLVTRLGVAPGSRTKRYDHVLCGEAPSEAAADLPSSRP